MRTIVYVDAFNLYFGALKGTPCKWLNIVEMVRRHVKPHHQIVGLKYFSAKLNTRPGDPGAPARQELYFRALHTVPGTEIVLGHYLTKIVPMPLANPAPGQNPFVQVIKTEEKGSDVNLAVAMVHDGYCNLYDCAIVISGDSDLLASVRIVKNELRKVVGVLNPQQRPCRVLLKEATFYQHLRHNFVSASVFPDTLADKNGPFSKPQGW